MSTSGNEEKPGEPFSVACPLHADGHPLGRNAVGQTTRVVDISCVILRDSDRVASCDCVMECGQNGEARLQPRLAACCRGHRASDQGLAAAGVVENMAHTTRCPGAGG